MKLRHTIVITPPFEVNENNPYEIVDADGSVIATTDHMFISEMIVGYLNDGDEAQIQLEEETAA